MMHFVFRVDVKMHCIANTWGLVLTSDFMLVVGHKTLLMEAKNVPFVLLLQFLEDTHRYSILYLSFEDLLSNTIYIE